MPVLDSMSTIQRWMQFAVTTTTIVVSTAGFVWAAMVFALDSEYVQIEDFDAFKSEIKLELGEVKSATQATVTGAVSQLQCDLMRSELSDLEATILYKQDHSIPFGLDQVLRDQKLRAFQGREDCH